MQCCWMKKKKKNGINKYTLQNKYNINNTIRLGWVRLGYCFTPYQRLRLYNGAPFSRLLRHAGDTEDVFSGLNPRRPHGGTIPLHL